MEYLPVKSENRIKYNAQVYLMIQMRIAVEEKCKYHAWSIKERTHFIKVQACIVIHSDLLMTKILLLCNQVPVFS